MLGKHTGHVNIRGNAEGMSLQANETTIAKMLQTAGYRTGLFGKWGLGDKGSPGEPSKQGFDSFAGYLDQVHAHDYYPEYLWRYTATAGVVQFDGKMTLAGNESGAHGMYTPDLFANTALNFIKNNKPDPLNKYRPFFLYLALTTPHANNEE